MRDASSAFVSSAAARGVGRCPPPAAVGGRGRWRRGAIPHRSGDRVDATALDPALRDHGLAANTLRTGDKAHRFQGLAQMRRHMRRPVDAKPHVGRAERGDFDALLRQKRRPCPIRSQPPPACTAQRQGMVTPGDSTVAASCVSNAHAPSFHPDQRQASRNSAPIRRSHAPQERRGLHDLGKHAPGAAGEDRLASASAHATASRGPNASEHRRKASSSAAP